MIRAGRVFLVISNTPGRSSARQQRIFDFPHGKFGSDREFKILALLW